MEGWQTGKPNYYVAPVQRQSMSKAKNRSINMPKSTLYYNIYNILCLATHVGISPSFREGNEISVNCIGHLRVMRASGNALSFDL